MVRVKLYLTFPRTTEKAFTFYKSVFNTEFSGKGIIRFKDIAPLEKMLPVSEEDKNLVMHVALPILGGHVLMGTDVTESMGPKVTFGNNVYICLQPETRDETKKLFKALSTGGEVERDLQEMSWGDYFGSCKDKFGIQWMFMCP